MTSTTPEIEVLPIIFDNTVLSNFALVEAFGILAQLYSNRAYISPAVLEEIQAGIESAWQYPWKLSRSRLEAILTGTLGILIKATTMGLLDRSEADTIHARMVDEGYRSPLAYERGISIFLNRPLH